MNMIGHNSGAPLDPDGIAHELERLGHAWADANAAASLLEETEKSVLAELASSYRGTCKSQVEADSLARSSRPFRDHIASMVQARKEANRRKVSWEAFKARVELMRTQSANERAAMSLR